MTCANDIQVGIETSLEACLRDLRMPSGQPRGGQPLPDVGILYSEAASHRSGFKGSGQALVHFIGPLFLNDGGHQAGQPWL